jgi:aminopeptidase N
MLDLDGASLGEREGQRLSYESAADRDPMAQKAYEYVSADSYAGITYGKTATVLLTLEGVIGEDTMANAMHTYFMKYRFTHPTKEDFLKTIEEVSGKDLRWYFNQAVYGSQVLDYEILSVNSFPANWYEQKKNKKDGKKDKTKDNTVYESYVTLHRKEDFVMPIAIEIKFDDGETIREHWDGQSRWTRFGYVKKAQVTSAELDPDHILQLDRNKFNNSFVVKANTRPTYKISNYCIFLTQLLSQFLAWWAV